MRVLTTEQMREADRRTIEDIGLPSIVLMENAGRQTVAAMEAAFDALATSRVAVLCGRGNNGGDGFVVARTLAQRGVEAMVFLLGSVAEVQNDARINLEVLGRIGMTVIEITNAQEWELHFTEVSECDVIITPHPGEMARLINGTVEAVQHDRLAHAREFATAHRVHVVLKGHRTVIAGPDGRSFVNLTGNAGMATGGTGDLLTGMIAAWFAQLLDAEAASKLSVYLHGAAGDLAAADEGQIALTASDVASRLGDAMLDLSGRARRDASD